MPVPLASVRPTHPLIGQYRSIRALSVRLTDTLSAEDQMLQSMPEASPAKWHLAHTTWFFETFVLAAHEAAYRPFDPAFSALFNSYYQALGTPFFRHRRGLLSRPGVEEVQAWRAHVDEAMEDLLAEGCASEMESLILLGLHHEQQHQELLLTDIKHAFFQNPLLPAYRQCRAPEGQAPPLRWVEYGGGVFETGFAGTGFAFDNESPRHKVFLQPFALASRLVTNAEYQAFMADNGYARADFWLSDGWEEICAQRQEAPLYWIKRGDEWWEYTHGGIRKLTPAAPVAYVSYFEADAFARWAGARLSTEQEWEHAAESVPAGRGRFLDLKNLSPVPAPQEGEYPAQLFGDCWEWTVSAYAPYPGFRPFTGVAGEYNGKFMCRQMVLRGGSCLTPPGHIRPTYRNFFSPSARWQCSGIRLAKGIK